MTRDWSAWPDGRNPLGRFTWSELETIIAKPPRSPKFSGRASEGYHGGAYNVFADYATAAHAMAHGWKAGRDKVGHALASAAAHVGSVFRPADTYDVGGERPNVPLACAGEPRSMVRRAPMNRRVRPVVRIVNNVSASAGVNQAHIANRGAAIVAWCAALEAAGYSTEVTTVDTGKNGEQQFQWFVEIKTAGERFDMDRMSFALICPDYLRRAMFVLLESCHDMANFVHGYGQPQDLLPDEIPAGACYVRSIRFDTLSYATPEAAVEKIRSVLNETYSNLQL